MIIDFVDVSMGDAVEVQAIRAQGREPVTINVSPRANAVTLVIDAIIERANSGGGYGVINLLRFFGHGARGGMGITNSEFLASANTTMVPDNNIISRTVIASQPHEFARLRPYFAANARVELHGCNVARGPEGRELLRYLADVWGVPVSAGSHTQLPGMGSVLSNFEGTVYTVYPDGRVIRNPNHRSHR